MSISESAYTVPWSDGWRKSLPARLRLGEFIFRIVSVWACDTLSGLWDA